VHAFSEESFKKSPLSPAGKEHAERGPGYISEADQFAKGGFGEVWRATRQTKGGMPSSASLMPGFAVLRMPSFDSPVSETLHIKFDSVRSSDGRQRNHITCITM